MSTQQELQGINLLTKAQYDAATRSENQLYAVQGQFVIETYENGTSWYRVYSDSWCIQMSRRDTATAVPDIITLLRGYNNLNYNIQCTKWYNSITANSRFINTYIISNTQFNTTGSYNNDNRNDYGYFWLTSGY